MTTTPASRRIPPGGWSLRRRLSASFLFLGLVTVVGILLAGIALARLNSAQHRQIDRLEPALGTSTDLFISLLNQETGIRGYAITRDLRSLEPYTRGRADTTAASNKLRDQVRDEPRLRTDVDALIAQANAWQDGFAEPALTLIRTTPRGVIPALRSDAGKDLFDQIRVRYDQVNADFAVARRHARRQLSQSTVLLVALVTAAALVSVLMSLALWSALRHWITRPLTALRAEVRTVAAGNLEHPVMVDGPSDIAELGVDAELMRKRLLTEYRAAVEARGEAQASAAQVSLQAAELRRSNAELEQFAYVASHDLQEPLRKVASFCQMLDRRYTGQLDERADQYIAFAVDGAKRMQILINDLLAFSRLGRSTAAFRPSALQACVDGAVSDLDRVLAEAGARVDVGELPVVPGDPNLLRQLFVNLIGNAVKFHSDEPPVVRISAQPNGDFWNVMVADNGIGIDPRYAEKIFAIFSRLHARDEYEGTGIGLALCRKIVEFHGGTIHVMDADPVGPGQHGATLAFTLPVTASAAAVSATDAASVPASLASSTTSPEGQP